VSGPPDWLTALLLGLIEGITEFIPVSSTGHLLLAEQWLPRQTDLFNIVIQSGAVLAVIPLFGERIRRMLFRWRDPLAREDLAKTAAAFGITGILGLGLDLAGFELPETATPVALSLVAGGVLFLVVERWVRPAAPAVGVTWPMVVAVGLAQVAAAAFPGLSRSGASIIALLVMGLARPAATEFAFIVGIPTLLSAGAWKLVRAAADPGAPAENWTMVVVGTVVSAVVSFAAVKWLLGYIRSHTFTGFGWYRIAVGGALLAFAWGR
jgi:undecaprenyl-diphosphatase